MRHYLEKDETTYDRKNGCLVTNTSKFLCVVVSIVTFLIAVVGMTLWIIYVASVQSSENGTKRMTNQPLYTETSSGKHRCVRVTPAKINRPSKFFFVA